jgi:hypothetical protein
MGGYIDVVTNDRHHPHSQEHTMRNALTGDYVTQVRDILTETVFLGAGTGGNEVRAWLEDGTKLGFTIYLGSGLSAQLRTVGNTIKHLNNKAPELTDEAAIARIHAAVATLKKRAASGEKSDHYLVFAAMRRGNELVNEAILAEYEAKGIQHMRWGGAVVEIAKVETARLGGERTSLRFYDGTVVTVSKQSLLNQED